MISIIKKVKNNQIVDNNLNYQINSIYRIEEYIIFLYNFFSK